MSWTQDQIADRAATEITDGMVVNLGIGLPTLVVQEGGYSIWNLRHGGHAFFGGLLKGML